MNRRALLRKISRGHYRNVKFNDFIKFIEGFGFRLRRIKGSHHIYTHSEIPGYLNLQPEGGEAIPYQLRQFLRLVEKYELQLQEKK